MMNLLPLWQEALVLAAVIAALVVLKIQLTFVPLLAKHRSSTSMELSQRLDPQQVSDITLPESFYFYIK